MEPLVAEFSVDLKDATTQKIPRHTIRQVPVLFKAGDYPDKSFKLDPGEIDKVIAEFKAPVQLDSEHKKSVFDGKLGSLVRVQKNKEGDSFSGFVAVPDWVDSIVPIEEQKLSVQFDNNPKSEKYKHIIGCAWTHNPRIKEAQLAASFMADEASNGELPSVQDATSAADSMNTDVQGKELFTKVRDMAKAAKEKADSSVHSSKYMKMLDKLVSMCDGFCNGKSDDDGDEKTADMSKASFNADVCKEQAMIMYNALVTDRRILPNQKNQFVSAYLRYSELDSKASFSNEPADNLKLFLDSTRNNKQHTLNVEELKVSFNEVEKVAQNPDVQTQTISPERVKQLLAHTSNGQAILNGKK